MFEKIGTFVAANKAQLIQKGVVVVGAIVGLAVALVIAKNTNNAQTEPVEASEAPASDETLPQE